MGAADLVVGLVDATGRGAAALVMGFLLEAFFGVTFFVVAFFGVLVFLTVAFFAAGFFDVVFLLLGFTGARRLEAARFLLVLTPAFFLVVLVFFLATVNDLTKFQC